MSGRNIFIDRLQIEIKIKNAQKYVEVLGFVPDEELDKIYKNSIAFVFPTLAEGFGLPPKEAIKAGTLAVVSDIPVLKEVYEDSVDYFDPMDINSIVESLQKIMNYTKSQREVKLNMLKSLLKIFMVQNGQRNIKNL